MSEAVREVPKKERPEFRNIHITQLPNYRLPLAGIVSILHRISGFLMFALLPFVLYMLQLSLTSEISFSYFHGIASMWIVKLITLALVWGYMQHFCAGVRHLFMDVHVAIEKDSARKTAASVLVISLALTALVALKLFGVF
ncbi:succinate dehydrogenase, cytochrome b556 subunit [Janthinobacterium agaricidamnosum]|uniref:Succinate dehydrogenase cytochrome b556 subunit n=1 Tax=Janthinobacterium agaricidamnosum NBRC 102515 = DSM 9628 TaxID=1349767 RepID=W0V949_9BURK|nr:succinate dehydrogenase, cytochrome b556 subunit [Janthinobacterium agaricidamnosum]CDG84115.1 succinate dehydrogenase, cytochrome b556 subunit [Janthinobacterium agaricidamnosum NBRC 102515 = DSM 9628]